LSSKLNHLGKTEQSELPIKAKHQNQCVFISNQSISSQNIVQTHNQLS